MKGEISCVICGKLHEHKYLIKIPHDFPNEWKICCLCLNIARFLVGESLEDTVDWAKITIIDGITEDRVRKIHKLITITG